jgi:glycosyltransferase involved in cell wall biosynthesis
VNICALIPAFNEAGRIAPVVRGVIRRGITAVVIDDGSSDGTAEAAEAAGAVCLRHAPNQGKGVALRAGIRYALDHDFSHLLFIDGDGQHRPEDIPSLVDTARRTAAAMVIGTRSFDRARMPLERYCSNRFGSLIASWLAGRTIRDSQSGFRLIRADALRGVKLRARKYEIEMEILIKLSRAGCRIEHAPVGTVYEGGQARSKMKPVRDTVRICLWSLAFRWGR